MATHADVIKAIADAPDNPACGVYLLSTNIVEIKRKSKRSPASVKINIDDMDAEKLMNMAFNTGAMASGYLLIADSAFINNIAERGAVI